MFSEMLICLIIFTSVTADTAVSNKKVNETTVMKKVVNKTIYVAVLPMAGFEQFYQDVSLLNLVRLSTRTIKNEREEIKSNICATIFRHPVMLNLQGADGAVDPTDETIQEDLRTKQPDLYNRYYKKVGNHSRLQFQNAYQKYNFSIRGVTVPEFVFPCLARNRDSNDIEAYLVSVDYMIPRLDNVISGHERKVAARFVFQHDDDRDETVLIAIVDKATDDVAPPHPNYCERAELTLEGRSKILCRLPDLQRMRLCASLLNSKNYTEFVRYSVPYAEAPEYRESSLVLRCGAQSVEFADWVLECRATRIDTDSNRPAIYYISRGLKPHQFFVATPMEDSPMPVVTHIFYSYLFNFKKLESE